MLSVSSPQPQDKPPESGNSQWASWLLIGIALAAVIALALVNTTSKDSQPSSSVAEGETHTIDVEVDGMAFVPNHVDVDPGTHLVVNFTNTGDQVHDLKIGDAETGRVDPGDTVQLDAGVIDSSIEGYCTIAGHRLQGMTFDVNVGDSTSSTGGHDHHHHAVAGASNPHVDVPSAAELGASREGFKAHDASLAPAANTTTHEETWSMTEEIVEVAPGVKQMQWLFNGQAPGPTLRGKVGDKFKITIKNEGSMAHSIDFHAGEVSPDENMKSIQPGEELTYEFTANRAGIWMYHCSTAPMSLHIANGMAGNVIIDPPDLKDVDAEYNFIANDVFLGEEKTGADAQRVADGEFDLMAFNYYPSQYDVDPIKAKVGDTVRLWILNVGPDQPLSFHVVGEQFDTAYKEGAYLIKDEEKTGSQAFDLLPAQGGFVEMTFNEPGTYSFVNHIMTNAEKGQHGKFVVTE
ncbi:multicopper oxidase domain-containing protein [Corynebacterium accolens]|uniref:multicopper oxidase domain-containing protein n=2 Tax=Corynebacterium accolens TaxID=38284 RepID=UPI001EDA2B10|nr:multicopper oxidase domain-containing protein [Corynebacterium accolens]MDK4310264.1 multicopper oxidase domain-containing protein [Corynebacterium accolens]MDK8471645.1 multicopper oxidase domain-containing protein [Corynebacterium accolens]MDK8617837.1 multicopper oxidase domain-containing protein [Corynebacterium accolens]